jgi:ubiquitin C-terminal hydrolase
MVSSTEIVREAPLRTSISRPAPLISRSNTQTTVPSSKQFVLRRAYKRYLIAQPPPVLVIHLKRFQQVGKAPSPAQLQFFANFKKLDDPVTFPEYLDIAPFLVPKREEFGLRTKKRERQMAERLGSNSKEKEGKCMYRLYAVVVHIGNMVSVCTLYIVAVYH